MVISRLKTELVVFTGGVNYSLISQSFNCIQSKSKMKILGIEFKYDLSWDDHIIRTLAKTNSLSYALRFLNSKLSRDWFRKLIHAHVLSRLSE